MKLTFKPRFYVTAGLFLLLFAVFGSNILFKKKIEINVVDNPHDEVLAASDETTLFGQEKSNLLQAAPTYAESKESSDIASYQPVTISHTVKDGDTLQSIAEKYHADAQTIADFPNNKLGDSLQLKVGQILIIPNGYIDGSFAPPPPPIAKGTGQFAWPAQGSITQYAYYWHEGSIDIALALLTPVKAADDGKVVRVERFTTGYGVHVIVDHGDGLTSLYGHLTDTKVVVGQGVRKGDIIGISGSTGRSTGPHLHFEVRRSGNPIDPMTLLPPL